MNAGRSMPSAVYGMLYHKDATPMNKKKSALAAVKFAGKFTVSSTFNTAKFLFNGVRVAGATVGAVLGAAVGTVSGGIYKGVQTLRHKETRPLSDYAIKSAQVGYQIGSVAAASTAMVGAVAGTVTAAVVAPHLLFGVAAAVGATTAVSALVAAVYTPIVAYENHKDGFSMTADGALAGCRQANQFIRRQEDRFLNWRKDSESLSRYKLDDLEAGQTPDDFTSFEASQPEYV